MLPDKANHRTALLIDATQGLELDYRERALRLVKSTGGAGIKADLYSLTPEGLTVGFSATASPDNVIYGPVDPTAFFAKLGYTLVIHATRGVPYNTINGAPVPSSETVVNDELFNDLLSSYDEEFPEEPVA